MNTWDDSAYLEDKPKLRAAIAALDAATPELERLDGAAGQADRERSENYARCLEQSRARFALYGVEKWSDLPPAALAEHDAMWAEGAKFLEAEKQANHARHEAFEAIAALFAAAEDEDSDVASTFRGLGWRGYSLNDMREAASNLGLKAHGRELRKAFYARPRAGIADVRVGTTLFLPHPASELRRVVKLTPTGMVDAKSLHDGGIARYRVNRWPAEARRITRAMAKEALAFAAEWKRRNPEKESVA